jgi:hypothetical protein
MQNAEALENKQGKYTHHFNPSLKVTVLYLNLLFSTSRKYN